MPAADPVPLRDPAGSPLRDPAGRPRTRACPGSCCGGPAFACRYYPAVLCSTWACEPPAMAQILPGAATPIYLCICPPVAATIGQVFRIQTRCYRITGAGVTRAEVPDSAWLYGCDGVLSPPVGSTLAASEHRLIAEPACGQGGCAVNLCGRYVRLTPCGNGPGCTRPVYARGDQYAYGRAVAVLCAGQTPAVTACYCAEATGDVILSSQLPANAIIWNFQATLEGCCQCAEQRGAPCCRRRYSIDYNRRDAHGLPGGDAIGRDRSCCCNLSTGTPSLSGEFAWGDFTLRVNSATVLSRERCSVTWRAFIDWTGRGASIGGEPPPIRSGRLGPYEWTLRCGGLVESPPQQAGSLVSALIAEGILDPFGDYDPWHLPLLFIRSSAVAAEQECGRVRVAASGTRNGVPYTGLLELTVADDDTAPCEGCGSGQGPGSGDVGGLIP